MTDVHRHTSNGEAKPHIHFLVRLDKHGLPTHGFRYECWVCGARLKKKSGVMVDEPKRAKGGHA